MPRTNKSPILLRARALIASCTPINNKNHFLLFKRPSNNKGQFHLLKHYHEYGFTREFEFSPSSTPLFRCPRWRPVIKKKGRRLLSILLCASNGGHHHDHSWDEVEVVSMVGDRDEEEDVSVDWRAERFIERFYEEMRIQCRRRSLLQTVSAGNIERMSTS